MIKTYYGFKLNKIKKAMRGLKKKRRIILSHGEDSPCSISMLMSNKRVDIQLEQFSHCVEYGMRVIFNGEFEVACWDSYHDWPADCNSIAICRIILEIFRNYKFKK